MAAVSRESEAVPSEPSESELLFSLPQALAGAARRGGREVDLDGLTAVVGPSWTMVAVSRESDLSRWPMYARDAFVVDGARLFGLNLRPLHPPEAARGLGDVAEFEQHFEASYKPLIHRALENGQAVLTWRGWPAVKGTPIELAWGLVEDTADSGIGFRGTVRWGPRSEDVRTMVLERPPVQLYVVETVTRTRPDRVEVLRTALSHARVALGNLLSNRFGVLTGSAAFGVWLARVCEAVGGGGGPEAWADQHCRLAAAVAGTHEQGSWFLRSCLDVADGGRRETVEALIPLCQIVVSGLRESRSAAADPAALAAPEWQQAVIEPLVRARDATAKMRSMV